MGYSATNHEPKQCAIARMPAWLGRQTVSSILLHAHILGRSDNQPAGQCVRGHPWRGEEAISSAAGGARY